MKYNLHRMRSKPGSVTLRQLRGALRERGWVLIREGAKHEIWGLGSRRTQVPRSLGAKWTVQGIIDEMIEAEEGA